MSEHPTIEEVYNVLNILTQCGLKALNITA